jgi:hypothetical protein
MTKPNPLVAQVPNGLVAGYAIGHELEHLALPPGPWETPEAFCRAQRVAGFSYGWHLNAEATGVNPHRICRRCVRIATERGFKVEIVPEIAEEGQP